jgi:para-nitrobenzyl esterase
MFVEVDTSHGTLRGEAREQHFRFLGVPYAEPPVGDLRFRPPLPPSAWSGVRDALKFGCVAPQDPLSVAPFKAAGPESEDCLYLNVFTPAADNARRPVMFWIHGGGFNHGAGSQPSYDGGPLAERGDVVVVTINYRLGALGYLYLGKHGGAEWGAASNAGQLDQIAALRCVRDNIAAFGGDPTQVTIFGESAGSVAVCSLLAMPDARGLFCKGIAQSGTANRLPDIESARELSTRFLSALGVPDADPEKLRAAPLAEILRAQRTLAGAVWPPVVDGRSVPQRPIAALREGVARDIPLLVGTTRDEHKLFVSVPRKELDDTQLERQVRELLPPSAADRANAVIIAYRDSRAARGLPHSNHDISDALLTASRFRVPATRVCEAQAVHQPQTFLYQFDWESPARHGELGACHGLEIPFVWGTVGKNGNPGFTGVGPEADQLAKHMMDAWIAFAKSGDPSHAGIGPWPAYNTTSRHTMIFGRNCGVSEAPFEEERAIWDDMLRAR